MTFIAATDAGELKAHLASSLTAPVSVDLFVRNARNEFGRSSSRASAPRSRARPATGLWVPGRRECETCDDTRRLLEEVAALSDNITLRVHDVTEEAEAVAGAGLDVDQVPALVLTGAARGRVRFLGIPAGLEFGTLLHSLIDVARGGTSLAHATTEALRGLSGDVHIRVFVTPSCPFCPGVARIAHRMAVESPGVTADVVEAEEFPELAERYRVRGVPKVVVNDAVEFVGAQPEALFLEHVLRAAT